MSMKIMYIQYLMVIVLNKSSIKNVFHHDKFSFYSIGSDSGHKKFYKIIYFNPASLLHPIDEGARVL